MGGSLRIGVIGIGQAGGRIADLMLHQAMVYRRVKEEVIPSCLAINTAKSDLMGLKVIPKQNRILVGQTVTKGHGVGLDRDLGKQVMEEEFGKIKRAIGSMGTYHIDAFLVVAGLGGGTGSSGAPVVCEGLKNVYSEPVYALGILPSEDEGELMKTNAARSVMELSKVVDGLILFDNNLWRIEGLPLKESYNVMNHELVKPFPYLLEAGETAGRMVGVKVVDASDIIKTLNGFSVIGWSEVKVQRRIFSFLRRRTSIDQLNPATMCQMSLVDASIRLTAECDIKSVKRALFLIAGPPSELSREGVERARSWLQQVVGDAEVRGGDFPIPGEKKITGILVLSGIDLDNLPRLKKIMSKISLR
ncbi:MAG: cell division protein [Candidatus Hecatellales archaeon]|nr:MAG: cell division protein [Candidatus Hecatellales archaeon]